MAAPNSLALDWDSIVTTTMRAYLSTELHDNIFNNLAFWAWLNAKGRKKTVSGGDFLVEPLLYGKNTTVKSFDGLDVIDTQPIDGISAATFNWKGVAGSLVFSLQDRLKNSGKQKIIDLLEARTMQLEESIRDEMNREALGDGTGNSGKDITGLQAIVGATGTLGGINRATYTWWQSKVDSTTETLSDLAKWRTIYNSAGGQRTKPDLILTTQAIYEWYEKYAEGKMQINNNQAGNPLADLGFETLKYKGAVLTYDEQAPTGNVFFLNSDYLRMRVHEDADFAKTEKKEPTNQLAYVWQLYWFGNITTGNCRRQGRLSGKTFS